MKKQTKSHSLENNRDGLSIEAQRDNFQFAEAFRTLRVSILFSFMEKDLKTLLVTSPAPSEGKTLTALNLGYTFAQTGKRVLMVDADLRKPKLSHFVDDTGEGGLTRLFTEVFSHDPRSGRLTDYHLSDLLWLLAFRKKSGLLRLNEGEERIQCHIQQGRLIDIEWLNGPTDPRLAGLLPQDQTVSQQAYPLMSKGPLTGKRLASLLIHHGVIQQDAMTDFIRRHLIEGLRSALRFQEGSFEFEALDLSGEFSDYPVFNLSELAYLHWQMATDTEAFAYLRKAIDQKIVQSEVENLSVLPCGSPPPNPSEMLASEQMEFLESYLKQRFDIIVLDTPPIIPTSDALVLAPKVDGVVLVLRSGVSDRKMAQKAVSQLQAANANLLGAVMNQVEFKRDGYYSYYRHYAKYSNNYGKTDTGQKGKP